jgi:hypothetical protein
MKLRRLVQAAIVLPGGYLTALAAPALAPALGRH